MKRIEHYIAIYDICNNAQRKWYNSATRRRGRISRILLEWGIRTQRSVFEIVVPPKDLPKLLARVKRFLRENDDKFYLYPLDKRSVQNTKRFGKEIAILQDIFI